MRVLLISPYSVEINMPTLPLGLACVAEATQRADHDVQILDLLNEKDTQSILKDNIENFHPDFIGISVRNIDDQSSDQTKFMLPEIKDVVNHCRHLSQAPLVLGGAGYTMYPESALAYLGADMGIQGEGESVFPNLIDRTQKGQDLSGLPGLFLPDKAIQGERIFTRELDTLPLPLPHLWTSYANRKQEVWIPVQSRRGCAMDCSYCSTATIEGRAFRKRSIKQVIEHIVRTVDAGFQRFYFTDNTFNIPSSYASELCRALVAESLNIDWRCIFYPGSVEEELIKDMAAAGCKEVALGFESGCEIILREMNKTFKLEQVRQASAMLADHGIFQMGFLLLGGPGETRESVLESLAFAESLKLDALKITVGIRIYPDTPLARIAENEGIISVEDDLLLPRFYLAKGLDGWVQDTVKARAADRPNWMT